MLDRIRKEAVAKRIIAAEIKRRKERDYFIYIVKKRNMQSSFHRSFGIL